MMPIAAFNPKPDFNPDRVCKGQALTPEFVRLHTADAHPEPDMLQQRIMPLGP
jgi:hypothetical protein